MKTPTALSVTSSPKGTDFSTISFLGVPLATLTALEGIQVGQSAKPQGSSNEFHWLSAAKAARWTRRLGRGPASAFVTHYTTVPTTVRLENEAVDVGCEHYGDMAGGLIFGNPPAVKNDADARIRQESRT